MKSIDGLTARQTSKTFAVAPPDGRVFLIRTAPGNWLVGGANVRVEFKYDGKDGRYGQLLRVEGGNFRGSTWTATRWLNGDETDYGLNIGKVPGLMTVRVGTY